MYISFHNPHAMQDDNASLATFRRMHLIAAIAELVIVIVVILGAVPAFHIASVGALAWQLSPTQSSVANVSLWGVTFAAICLVPLWRYAMLRPNPSLTQERVLRRLLATSLITYFFCGAPALLACTLFVLNSLRGGAEWLYFLLLSLILFFVHLPVRSNWEERLRAIPQAAIHRDNRS